MAQANEMDDFTNTLARDVSPAQIQEILTEAAPRIEKWQDGYRALGWPQRDGLESRIYEDLPVSLAYATAVGAVVMQATTGEREGAAMVLARERSNIGLFLHSTALQTMFSSFKHPDPEAGQAVSLALALNIANPRQDESIAGFAYTRRQLMNHTMFGDESVRAVQARRTGTGLHVVQPRSSYDALEFIDRSEIIESARTAVRDYLGRKKVPNVADLSVEALTLLGIVKLIGDTGAVDTYGYDNSEIVSLHYLEAFNTAVKTYRAHHPKGFLTLLGADGREIADKVAELIGDRTFTEFEVSGVTPRPITTIDVGEATLEEAPRDANPEQASTTTIDPEHMSERDITAALIGNITKAYKECSESVEKRRAAAEDALAAQRKADADAAAAAEAARLKAEADAAAAEAARLKDEADAKAAADAHEKRIQNVKNAFVRDFPHLGIGSLANINRADQAFLTSMGQDSTALTRAIEMYRQTPGIPDATWLSTFSALMMQQDMKGTTPEDDRFIATHREIVARKVLPWFEGNIDAITATTAYAQVFGDKLAAVADHYELSEGERAEVHQALLKDLFEKSPALLFDAAERIVHTPPTSLNPIGDRRIVGKLPVIQKGKGDPAAISLRARVRQKLVRAVEDRYGFRAKDTRMQRFLIRCGLAEAFDFASPQTDPRVKDALIQRIGKTFSGMKSSNVPRNAKSIYYAVMAYMDANKTKGKDE